MGHVDHNMWLIICSDAWVSTFTAVWCQLALVNVSNPTQRYKPQVVTEFAVRQTKYSIQVQITFPTQAETMGNTEFIGKENTGADYDSVQTLVLMPTL